MAQIAIAARDVKVGDRIRMFAHSQQIDTVEDVFVYPKDAVTYLTFTAHAGSLEGDYKLRSEQVVYLVERTI